MTRYVPGHLGSVMRQNRSMTLVSHGELPVAPEVICKQLLTSQAFKYFAGSIKRFGGVAGFFGLVFFS